MNGNGGGRGQGGDMGQPPQMNGRGNIDQNRPPTPPQDGNKQQIGQQPQDENSSNSDNQSDSKKKKNKQKSNQKTGDKSGKESQ